MVLNEATKKNKKLTGYDAELDTLMIKLVDENSI